MLSKMAVRLVKEERSHRRNYVTKPVKQLRPLAELQRLALKTGREFRLGMSLLIDALSNSTPSIAQLIAVLVKLSRTQVASLTG